MSNTSYHIITCKIERISKNNIVCLVHPADNKNDERYIKLKKGTDSFSSKILQAINDEKLIIGEYYAFVQRTFIAKENIQREIIACLFKTEQSIIYIPINWSDDCIIK